MASLLEHASLPYIAGGTVALVSTALLLKKLVGAKKKEYPRDTVILHQFDRGPWAPNFSPYPIKLETYLRMAKLPYEPEFKDPMSKKNKSPWITYNGEDIADSHFCIEYLNKKFNVDLNSHLTAEQKAIGRAFQTLVEDNLYWVIVCNRWLFEEGGSLRRLFGPLLPWFVPVGLVRREIRRQVMAQGTGRHTPAEVQSMARLNLDALETYLGNKKFLFGDKPSEFDCTVFGMLSQALWQMPGSPPEAYLKEKCPNLVEYCGRMKETFWPDWDDCITHGHTRKATK